MKRERLILLVASCVVGALSVVAATRVSVPQPVQIALGMLMVFVVPGFVLVSAVVPPQVLSRGERLLASVGMSLALATSAAVLLGATPFGLSGLTFAVVLEACTLAFACWAVCGARVSSPSVRGRDHTPNGSES